MQDDIVRNEPGPEYHVTPQMDEVRSEDPPEYHVGPCRRVTSISLEQVKKNKQEVTRITISWQQEQLDGEWGKSRDSSTQEPSEDFRLAFNGLLPHALTLCHLPPDYISNCEVVEVKFAYDDDEDTSTAQIGVRKLVVEGEVRFTTPAVALSGNYEVVLPPDACVAVGQAHVEALIYIDKVRAAPAEQQTDLFRPEEVSA